MDLRLNFSSPVIVFDTETGGLHADYSIAWEGSLARVIKKGDTVTGIVQNQYTPILEIAATRLNQFTLGEEDSFYSLCGPEEDETLGDLLAKCEKDAFNVNKLDQRLDELEKAPPLSKVMQSFIDWATLGGKVKNFIPAGQNVQFDINMVNAACKRAGVDYQIIRSPLELRSYSQFYFALPETPIVANYKLTTISEALGISTKGAHEALEDVRMTAECLKLMFRRFSSI